MQQSDTCTQCGGMKMVRVIFTDGNYLELLPGAVAPADPQFTLQIETCCSQCGLMYSMASLENHIQLYQ